MNNVTLISALENAIFNNGLYDASVRSYSGRGMYSKECVGLQVESTDRLLEVIGYAIAESENKHERMELVKLMTNSRSDRMGRDMIVYWPSMEATDALIAKESEE